MTDYSALGDALRVALLSDAWIGNPANVKTVEVFQRGMHLRNEDEELGFAAGEMPAIVITPNIEAKISHQITAEEMLAQVRAEVAAISCSRDARAGERAHQTIAAQIESVLEMQKDAQNDLGLDAVVSSVMTRRESYKRKDYFFHVSRAIAVIRLIELF